MAKPEHHRSLRRLLVVLALVISALAVVSSGQDRDISFGEPIESSEDVEEAEAPPAGNIESSSQFVSIEQELRFIEPSDDEVLLARALELANSENWTELDAVLTEAGISDENIPLNLAPMYLLSEAYKSDAVDSAFSLNLAALELEDEYIERGLINDPTFALIEPLQQRTEVLYDQAIEQIDFELFESGERCERWQLTFDTDEDGVLVIGRVCSESGS